MDLPNLESLDVYGKRVIVRADLDVETLGFEKDLRIRSLIPTLDYLKEHKAEIVLLGHRGRPEGKYDQDLSLKPFEGFFSKWNVKLEENLRFDPGEEKNDPEFVRQLAGLADVYINEAFGNSHREHASIVGVPKLLPHAAGFHFIKEVENLSRVFENPVRPVVAIISGVKKDKLDYIQDFEKFADKILIAGRLPEYLGNKKSVREFGKDEKVIIANLIFDKEDITPHSIQRFKEEIAKAKTIVLAGVLGKYEDQGHRQATKEIFTAVSESSAFKVVGGGHSLIAIEMFDLTDKFNWVSVGGGAMLEYLAKGTLPGIKALLD